jgi:NAD(P)-dependent dehydrogenase (short-subunit alcohol dehydrogenase family)
MKKLTNKTAIITGGTSGMGKATALLFAAEGAAVVISGRDEERGKEVAASITDEGGKAVFVPGDISTYASNEALVHAALENFGGLDIIFPNAGMLGLASITEVSLDTWHQTINTNLNAVFYLIKLAIPEMLKGEGGSIVVNASIAATKAFPNHAAYCASKGALIPLVKQIALDYGPAIRANVICPGPVDTPLIWESAQAFPEPEKAVQKAGQRVPMQRLGQPEDIAKMALFLASEDAAWITGSVFTVDGGATTGE